MARPRSGIEPRILRAARRRFLAEGVDGASLRAIAKDARTSIGMVHYYCPSKDDLFLAVVEQVYLGLLADLEARLGPEQSVRERIAALYDRVGALDSDEREVVRLIVREAMVSGRRLERLIERFQRGHLPLLFRLVRDGLADGTFAADVHPTLVLAAMLMLGGPGQALLSAAEGRLPFRSPPRGSARTEALVSLLFRGVGPR